MTLYNRFNSYDYLDKIKKFASLPYSSTAALNNFTFDATTGVIGVNVDSTKAGYISEIFSELTAGDVIEVAAEVKNISGVKVKVNFEEYNAAGTTSIPVHTYSTQRAGEWETLNFKYIFRDSNGAKKARVVVGVFTTDIGEFQLRNLRISIKTKRKYVSPNASMEVKPFELKKGASVFEIRTDFANGGGTLSVVDTKTIRITFNERFLNSRPVAAVSNDYASSTLSYNIRVGNLTKDFAEIMFANNSGTTVTLDTIPENCHFGVVFIGN